jgi:hypothetical protein
MLPLAGNEKFRVRVRSKNENDSGGPRERKPRPRRRSSLVARNRSSIVLVLVLVSAIGCKSEDVGVPKRTCPEAEGAKDHGRLMGPLRVRSGAPSASGLFAGGDTVPRVNPGLNGAKLRLIHCDSLPQRGEKNLARVSPLRSWSFSFSIFTVIG